MVKTQRDQGKEHVVHAYDIHGHGDIILWMVKPRQTILPTYGIWLQHVEHGWDMLNMAMTCWNTLVPCRVRLLVVVHGHDRSDQVKDILCIILTSRNRETW